MKNILLVSIFFASLGFDNLGAETMKVAIDLKENQSSIVRKISDCLIAKIFLNRDLSIVDGDSESWDTRVDINGLRIRKKDGGELGDVSSISFEISAFFGTNSMERKLLIRDLNNNARATHLFAFEDGNQHLLQHASASDWLGFAGSSMIESEAKQACDHTMNILEALIKRHQDHQKFYREHPVDRNE